MIISDEIKEQLTDIIKRKEIKTLFQPIVSLKNGSVLAYEAFSRITLKKCRFTINDAFDAAREMNCYNVKKAMELIRNTSELSFSQGCAISLKSIHKLSCHITTRVLFYPIRQLKI